MGNEISTFIAFLALFMIILYIIRKIVKLTYTLFKKIYKYITNHENHLTEIV